MIRTINKLLLIAAIIAMSAPSNFAFAQASAEQSITERTELNKAQASRRLNQIIFKPKANSITKDNIGDVVASIDDSLKKYREADYPSLNSVAQRLTTLGQQVADCVVQNCEDKHAIVAQLNRKINRDSGTANVVLPSDNGTRTIDLFRDVIDQYCDDTFSSKCAEASNLAITVWQAAGQYRHFANLLNTTDKVASNDSLTLLDEQWRSYRQDTIKLWPQEVFLSSLIFQQKKDGFTPPPSSKVLALRPALGLSYLSDGSPDLRPSLNLDLLGLYWWKYNGAKAGKGRGLAASLVWSGDDTAYGITYHHNPRWSATVAHSDENDLVLSISFQLGYALLGR